MQIMIEIPEDVKAIIDRNGTNEIVAETLWQAIKNGTPLPKGHGRLVDADAYRKEMLKSREFNFFTTLDCQPTIIEADSEPCDDYDLVYCEGRDCSECSYSESGED